MRRLYIILLAVALTGCSVWRRASSATAVDASATRTASLSGIDSSLFVRTLAVAAALRLDDPEIVITSPAGGETITLRGRRASASINLAAADSTAVTSAVEAGAAEVDTMSARSACGSEVLGRAPGAGFSLWLEAVAVAALLFLWRKLRRR